jgi:hypothetical protein
LKKQRMRRSLREVLGEVAVGEGWKGWSHGGDRWSAAVGKDGPEPRRVIRLKRIYNF